MSVRYTDHPAQTSVDPTADWFPFWDTSAGAAEKCTINNAIATAVLPAANIPNFTIPLTKLEIINPSTILGRTSASGGIPQQLTLSADLSISSGGVLGLTGTFQPSDADLAAIAALATQPFGRSLLTAADPNAARVLLQLLVPTSWSPTDRLVTTHLGSLLADVGAGGALGISPITTATDASLVLKSKGSSPLILSDESGACQLQLTPIDIGIFGGQLNVHSTAPATNHLTGALIVKGGAAVNGSLYVGAGETHLSSDGSAVFASGEFTIDATGGISINEGRFLVDEDGHTRMDGTLSVVPQYVTLGAGVVQFAAISSVMVVTGTSPGNTVGLITGGVEGTELDVYFTDAFITLTDTPGTTANSLNLSTGPFVSSANDMISFRKISGKWFERSRSVN